MKKYVQIISVLIVFTLLVIAKQSLSSGRISFQIGDDDENRRVVAPSGLPLVSPTPIASANDLPSSTQRTRGQYKDGSYTGTVADAYYGYIQVQAIVSGGVLSDVKFLQYPNDNRTSISINTQAMPYLKQEAIQAQSAKVNTVSGASDSSAAFRESLSAALKQAV